MSCLFFSLVFFILCWENYYDEEFRKMIQAWKVYYNKVYIVPHLTFISLTILIMTTHIQDNPLVVKTNKFFFLPVVQNR